MRAHELDEVGGVRLLYKYDGKQECLCEGAGRVPVR